MKKIYFLCTGNSCRSQMAEGFAKQMFGLDWEVASAGIETHGVNPFAIKAMAEVGIDLSHNTSKLIDTNYLNQCDLVVTLCGDARDRCPMTPPTVKKLHWPLPDPAQATGTEIEKMEVFRKVRDQIHQNVQNLIAELA
ncbi:arsenate reductase (thioredoxin) [Levilactobacillus brevis]|uniref:arsenate reductase (thioredoxin) n=1 Tax=Levilactobacillus brevis TaxID=1580 RepID=UPI0005B63976|nr:arsenate reductase (thioredoxin) [Levilactobacillus brevis]KIR08748.1 arsenate reductase [Levilactobacillus brevis]MBT9677174.1 arsenate reductase (thioredoxin) [Levilactobacillus brevis]MCT3583676.1 arsenate reductase (thioredoxin) [Levilactobacillus brevis]MCZ2120297.1 arsenate reductase (thioredoxin) [Levilactobacillus brevis]MCZ2125785.1 arsenate reductase (thioredoxin) [Levilactobacillus brevis]